MNVDPWRWCFECRSMRRRDGFVPVGHTKDRKPMRYVCAECAERIRGYREQHKNGG